jgi:hypothetical protein
LGFFWWIWKIINKKKKQNKKKEIKMGKNKKLGCSGLSQYTGMGNILRGVG